MSEDSITVSLRNCTVPLFVGIYDHEKPQAQPIIIAIDVTAPLAHHYGDPKVGEIASVINYETLFSYVTNTLPNLGHVPLLESVAENIIAFCFKDPRIQHVRVRLDKPKAFEGKALAGIEMSRTRGGV